MPVIPVTPSASKSRQPPLAASKTVEGTGRKTKSRSAKDDDAVFATPAPVLRSKPSMGLLARSKEAFTKTSDMVHHEKSKTKKSRSKTTSSDKAHTETLQAFLRIRPPPAESSSTNHYQLMPYLEIRGEKEVLMRPPLDPSRLHLAEKAPQIFSFDRVFPPGTQQDQFFTETTLPLVEKLLHGENGLMFAFGVSNSGKSFTISGGQAETPEDRGLLPRSIDVVFNSIEGSESNLNLRCEGLDEVVVLDDDANSPSTTQRGGRSPAARASEVVNVDRNYSYAVFVSYAEVYNEKIFDLLDAVLPSATSSAGLFARSQHRSVPDLAGAPSTWGVSPTITSSISLAALANGGGGIVKRRALALKNDPQGGGKYIAGLNEVRVRTRDDALAVVMAGQKARQVFGTLANRESSRSHGIFTIKVARIHNGAPEDPESMQMSRLAIVDLAGSERNRNTGTTGDRLKEAGNINKSLMVLGQCLEVLRANQQKSSSAIEENKKKLAIVPFRHSKLTEIFQNFFAGDGRAVMIVNVNPYDTGYDENAHVMRFSAVAREVQTTSNSKPAFSGNTLRRQLSTQFNAFKHAVAGPSKIKVVVPVIIPPQQRMSDVSSEEDTSDEVFMVEEELEVVEEDAEGSEDERDPLVEYLFEQLRDLRLQVHQYEMEKATMEADIREELGNEVQQTMDRMQQDYTRRIQQQMLASEEKTDRKIELVERALVKSGSLDESEEIGGVSISEQSLSSDGEEVEWEEQRSVRRRRTLGSRIALEDEMLT